MNLLPRAMRGSAISLFPGPSPLRPMLSSPQPEEAPHRGPRSAHHLHRLGQHHPRRALGAAIRGGSPGGAQAELPGRGPPCRRSGSGRSAEPAGHRHPHRPWAPGYRRQAQRLRGLGNRLRPGPARGPGAPQAAGAGHRGPGSPGLAVPGALARAAGARPRGQQELPARGSWGIRAVGQGTWALRARSALPAALS